jgi:hypothetical protein
LFVKNNEKVLKDQPIGIIENTADYKDVLYLEKSLIEALKRRDYPLNTSLPLKEGLVVGPLTENYMSALKAFKTYELYNTIHPNKSQLQLLKRDILNYYNLLERYKTQEKIAKDQLELAVNDFNRSQRLLNEGAISVYDYELKKKEYLSVLNNTENIKISISNVMLQINSNHKNIMQLQVLDQQELYRLKEEINQILNTLIARIDEWKQLYLLRTPISGFVSFTNFWSKNQQVKVGDELFTVVPENKEGFIGKCNLPIRNSAKVKIGQRVNIKLANYSFEENGMLIGEVINVSRAPLNDVYTIDINLPHGLNSSYNKQLLYKENMTGKADIITKNLSIMDRVFFNLRSLLEFGSH